MEKCGEVLISRKALLSNIKKIKSVTGNKKICFMIKANAYGHGIETIVNYAHNYIDFFGVSNINEAIKVKLINPNSKVLIVGKTFSFLKCAKYDCSFVIESKEHFYNLLDYLAKNPEDKKRIKIHLKINCGMNRLGISNLADFKKIYNLAIENAIVVEGIATHFSTADCDDITYLNQEKIFKKFLNLIPKRQKPIISVGGSGVARQELNGNKFSFDMIRIGLALYGYGPKALNLRPILSVKSHIIKILEVKKGCFVGYGKGYCSKTDVKVGIIPLGYGDGISRLLSNKFYVFINGEKAKSIGYVCMDMFFVDLTNVDAKIGDEVVVFNDAKKWAQIMGTIPYEVLTNLKLIR